MNQRSYSAGSLQLNILGINQSAIKSIDSTISHLNRLSNALNKISNAPVVSATSNLSLFFTRLSNSTRNIDVGALKALGDSARAVSSVTKLTKIQDLDFNKISSGFLTLAHAIEPFLQRIKEAEVSLTSLYGILQRVNTRQLSNLGQASIAPQNRDFLSTVKWTTVLYAARALGRGMADIVQAGSDYAETLNLWQVSMRENLGLAEQFISKMSRAYGISEETLMRSQATFKNMIGSLGQISDETSYKLSEALVKMSLDFSSLYNTSVEQAFTKMEAMLAGQVRPIRSVAGLDITESTLFQFYKELGGEKSVRQLNRTEKQLLSILAVFKQMGTAGALGDMSKTINSFANQSRIMSEQWAETKTWSGLLLKDLITSSGLLQGVNTALIITSTILKSIALSKGLGKENYLNGLLDTTTETNEEVDKLQKKLLDFDKFRALNSSNDSVQIDKTVLDALADYTSQTDKILSNSQETAENILRALGAIETESGELIFTGDNLKYISDTLELIIISLGTLVGSFFVVGIQALSLSIKKLGISFNLLNTVILGGAIWAIVNLVDAFKEGDQVAIMLYTTISTLLVGAFISLNKEAILTAVNGISKFILSLQTAEMSTKVLAAGIGAVSAGFAIMSFSKLFNSEASALKKWTTAILGLASAFAALAVASRLMTLNWSSALAITGLVTSTVFSISNAIPNFENGASDIDSGTVFRAGEFGKTEAVYTASNGKTNVANVKQMEQAFYNALVRYKGDGQGDIVVNATVGGETVFKVVASEASKRGLAFSKV